MALEARFEEETETHRQSDVAAMHEWYGPRHGATPAPDVSRGGDAGLPGEDAHSGLAVDFEEFLPRLMDDWTAWHIELDDVFDGAEADMVIGIGRYRGRYKATGGEAIAPFVQLWRERDGNLEWLEQVVFDGTTDSAAA
jgi:hypothetical protein